MNETRSSRYSEIAVLKDHDEDVTVMKKKKRREDNVNHPRHYNTGNIEVIDIIRDKLTEEEFRGYIKGNVLKYITRERHKNGLEDLEKAAWYLNRLIAELKGKVN